MTEIELWCWTDSDLDLWTVTLLARVVESGSWGIA